MIVGSVNAVVESFFGTLKQERVQWRHYQSRHAAHQDILQYITMFYNSQRKHSYLDYKSPNQYESDMANLGKAAQLGKSMLGRQFAMICHKCYET